MLEAISTLFVMSIVLIGAPGPAAIALTATGAAHDMRQGLPLIIGLVIGVLLTGLMTSLGVTALFSYWPASKVIVQLVGAIFIIALAIRMIIASNTPNSKGEVQFSYCSGIFMNILNPKAYATFLLLTSRFMPPISNKVLSIAVLEAVAFVATIIVAFGWLFIGRLLGNLVRCPHRLKRLQQTFAVLMIIFILPIIMTMPSGT